MKYLLVLMFLVGCGQTYSTNQYRVGDYIVAGNCKGYIASYNLWLSSETTYKILNADCGGVSFNFIYINESDIDGLAQ